VITTALPVHELDEQALQRRCWADDAADEFQRADRARVVSLRRANVEHLTLAKVDLRACRFFGAHNLHALSVESADSFALSPARFGRARRQAIAEEHEFRAGAGGSRAKSWFAGPTRGSVHAGADDRPSAFQIASVYRGLRRGQEDSKNEPGAADFYYGEMEMRRKHDPPGSPAQQAPGDPPLDMPAGSRAERGIITAYWLLSGYGLRASRAFLALAVTVLLFTVLFHLYGFQDRDKPFARPTQVVASERLPFPPPTGDVLDALISTDAWSYSAGTATAIVGAPDSQLRRAGRVLRVGLRIVGPMLIGLGLLALRGRVKR
jgi:hypothetical protein